MIKTLIFTSLLLFGSFASAKCLLNGAWYSPGSIVGKYHCDSGRFKHSNCLNRETINVSPDAVQCIHEYADLGDQLTSVESVQAEKATLCAPNDELARIQELERRCLELSPTTNAAEDISEIAK